MIVLTRPMPAGVVFDWHTHAEHQLVWGPSGVLSVRTDQAAWVLPPTRALWIPAGIRHETLSASSATMSTAYIRPDRIPIQWTEPTPVAAGRLLGEIIAYLDRPTLGGPQRARAEAVLADLLEPVAMADLDVRMPAPGPALRVANALLNCPADPRTLTEWGREVGASERTLARAFLTSAGLSFGRWRVLLRLREALPMLAAGEPVGTVARRVGYETPSAFVAAFRRQTGSTPTVYFGRPGRG